MCVEFLFLLFIKAIFNLFLYTGHLHCVLYASVYNVLGPTPLLFEAILLQSKSTLRSTLQFCIWYPNGPRSCDLDMTTRVIRTVTEKMPMLRVLSSQKMLQWSMHQWSPLNTRYTHGAVRLLDNHQYTKFELGQLRNYWRTQTPVRLTGFK